MRAAVTWFGPWWLLEVSDAAVHRPPAPARGRDAARGGLGLSLVARICAAHGWHADGDRKNVWALLPQPNAERAGTGAPGAAEQLRLRAVSFAGALGFRPAIHLVGPVDQLPGDVVTDLDRVLEEALTNVADHAHASCAEVTVDVTHGEIRACICDDGVGLAGAPGHGGLADLHRRAAWYGGSLTVEPGPGGGTRLQWRVPHRLLPRPRPTATATSTA